MHSVSRRAVGVDPRSYFKPIAKASLGVCLAGFTALGAGFVLDKLGLSTWQVLVGRGAIGSMALAAYVGGALLGSQSKEDPEAFSLKLQQKMLNVNPSVKRPSQQ